MKLQEARQLIKRTFENPFNKEHFTYFISNLLKDEYEEKPFTQTGAHLPDAFAAYIRKMERIGKYEDETGNIIDILLVELKKDHSIEWARTTQRNFIRRYLNGSRGGELKDAAIVAFYTEGSEDWRFSLIKMQYSLEKKKDELTPAKRFSFLVGKNEKSHTAQKQLTGLLTMDSVPTLADIESSFNIETVTREFFEKYKEFFLRVNDFFEKQFEKNRELRKELQAKHIDHISFTKKLLGQIVFLYFLQKKGWLGVPKDGKWGEGDKRFLRSLLEKATSSKKIFYTDYLQYLFYEALAEERRNAADPSYYRLLDCKIPFLNGGLFEADYDWKTINVKIPNDYFTNENITKEGDTGDGILDVFDRYNFTVKEDEPLEKEVAVDPEMLGKVFEKLLEVTDRKSKGAFYTPREIVHYMCQESLINYLGINLNSNPVSYQKLGIEQTDMFGNKIRKGQLPLEAEHGIAEKVPRKDLEKFIREGTAAIDNDARVEKAGKETDRYSYQLPEAIRNYATDIDKALADIRVCDLAIGSGAFPVGIMNEIVKAREILTTYLPANKQKDRTAYELKRHCIQECIYGVDIDHSAIDIAKLRLWLSLVVDEEDFYKIKPLPNLDYKIVEGNSLIAMPDGIFRDAKLEDEIRELEDELFDERDKEEKDRLRSKIVKKIRQLLDSAEQFAGYKIDFDLRVFFNKVFKEKKGFDLVIGNPPYVGQKGHKEIFQEIKMTSLGKKYHQRRMDLFYFFFHCGMQFLKQKGILSFITTNYYLTATYSDKLRKHIYEDASIISLINFNELKIFESATGQHNLITSLVKGKNNEIQALTSITKRTGVADENLLVNILNRNDSETYYYNQPQQSLFEDGTLYIRIEPSCTSSDKSVNSIHSILSKIKNGNKGLDEYCYIEQGIVSGADKVSDSLIKKYPALEIEKGEGIYILTNKEIKSKAFTASDRSYLKKTYKNSDLKKWTFSPNDSLNVLYIKSTGKYFEPSSGVKSHLDRFKLILINRNVRIGTITEKDYEKFLAGKLDISYIMNANSMKAGNYYCLSYPRRGQSTFEVPKIVNSRRANSNIFAIEDKGYYEQSDLVITTLKPNYENKLSLLFLLGILNSKLLYQWFYHKGKRKGEALELFQKPLSEVPIKFVEGKQQSSISNIVEKIIETKKQDPQANIRSREKQLDILVYHLYNLTYDEARIIDPELSEEEFAK